MSTPLRLVMTLCVCAALVALCTPAAPPDSRTTPRPRAAPKQRAADLGRQAASKLRAALGKRVRAAMQRGGPAEAIAVCAGEALTITAAVNETLAQGVTIRRTSLRVRNPKNAPDAAERRALKRLGARPDARAFVQAEPRPGGTVYRYFQPIRTVGMCLRCHGPADKLAPAIRAELRKRYPDDRATGYGPGELRGVFSVTIPAAALP